MKDHVFPAEPPSHHAICIIRSTPVVARHRLGRARVGPGRHYAMLNESALPFEEVRRARAHSGVPEPVRSADERRHSDAVRFAGISYVPCCTMLHDGGRIAHSRCVHAKRSEKALAQEIPQVRSGHFGDDESEQCVVDALIAPRVAGREFRRAI